MIPPASRPNRAFLIKLGLVALGGLVVVVLVLRGFDLKELFQQALAMIREAGPLLFFCAMAILPAVGAPLLAFALSAGPVFSEKLGLGGVIGFSLLAMTVNMALSYFLANRALRPLLEKLCQRLGYQLPRVETGDAADLILVVRLTPGVPFPVQNYLLGLAQVPFWKYLGLSCVTTWSMVSAVIVFGDSLLQGKGKVAMIAFSLFLALLAATHLLLRHYKRKKTL